MEAPAKTAADALGAELTMLCYNGPDLEDVLLYRRMVEDTMDADLIIIRCMTEPGRAKWYERYEKVLKEATGLVLIYSGSPDVRFVYRDLFSGTDEEFLQLTAYVGNRGAENDAAIVHWMNRRITGKGEVPPPLKQRADGIYHPDFDRNVSSKEYFESLDPDKPIVGIMFTSNLWVYRNTGSVDGLIRAMESIGLQTIPVFYSLPAKGDGKGGSALIAERYFKSPGGPRIDVLVSTSPFSHLINSLEDNKGVRTDDSDNFLKNTLDVPVLNVMNIAGHYPDYKEVVESGTRDVPASLFWPEVDGQIISVPMGSIEGQRGAARIYNPIPGRVERIARLARGWATLRRKPVEERKIAILVYHLRPEDSKIGSAAGLDTIESVSDMLKGLCDAGYKVDDVPENGRELIDSLLSAVTNNLDWSDSKFIMENATYLMGKSEYAGYLGEIPEFNREWMLEKWGKPPGDVCSDGGKIIVPGVTKGNVYVGYQPPRGRFDAAESLVHDPLLPNTHQYLAFYRWLRDGFGADAVIHVGTHGTLEWLPGRSNGLSGTCCPDVVMDSVPHLYPYIIDDPGEGIQAKRRSEAVLIGHMCPTMAKSGGYGETAAIEMPMQQLFSMKDRISDDRKDKLLKQIYDACVEISIFDDLGLAEKIASHEDLGEYLPELHEYLFEIKDSIVRDGLHILGRPPEGERLSEAIYSLTRLRNRDVPSMRYAIGDALGLDTDAMADRLTETDSDGNLNSETLERIDGMVSDMIEAMSGCGFDTKKSLAIARERFGASEPLEKTIVFVCDTLVPNLERMTDEMSNLLLGLEGRYVPPGPSGAPTRGCAHLLPMGRNYYSVDPEALPTKAAWETGKTMAEQMISKYTKEKGEYPKEIGFIIWATDTMKTDGDDVAYILWLMGVKPVWSESGRVTGLEVVPLEELGRPRLDVTVRITGLFRDAFPNLIDLIDEAVLLVSGLDEPNEDNILAANLRKDIVEYIGKGVPEDEARRKASARIFGCPPGAYGSGVTHAIEDGSWKTVQDLADIYITWAGHAYGKGLEGTMMRDEFIHRFAKVGVTIKNMPDREIDMLDTDDVYGYLGGLNAFVRAYGRSDVMSFVGDSSNPDKVRTRETAEECKFLFRSKLLNPKFIEGLKEHGFRGAAEIAKLTEHVFGWDATSDIVEGWMYEGMAERFLYDDDTREWMMEQNPDALMKTISRLQEAIDREMWDADEETRERLRSLFMEAEGVLERIHDR